MISSALADGVETARVDAAAYNEVQVVSQIQPGTSPVRYLDDVDPPSGSTLAYVMAGQPQNVYVFPSGLAIDERQLNWIWSFPDARPGRRGRRYYIGTANEAEKWARRWKVDTADVEAVCGSDIHGTCVFEPGPRFDRDPRDWKMTQAHGFPK